MTQDATKAPDDPEVTIRHFAADGSIPNNPTLPLLIYEDVLDLASLRCRRERASSASPPTWLAWRLEERHLSIPALPQHGPRSAGHLPGPSKGASSAASTAW